MSDQGHEFDRAEVERAFDRTLALQAEGNWKEWVLTLSEDIYNLKHGIKVITEWTAAGAMSCEQ